MCKIRTIILNENKEITCDFMLEVKNIEINVIDRPAFCIFVPTNSNGYASILLKYSNLKEEIDTEVTDDNVAILNIGQKSGCIYSFMFKENMKLFHIKSLKQKLVRRDKTIRYQRNVKNFVKLISGIKKGIDMQLTCV